MTRNAANLRLKLLRLLRPWHRRLGLFGVGFVLFLALSGILINHSNDLSLDTSHVEQAWLLDYYGINTPKHLGAYQYKSADGHTLSFNITDNILWLDHHQIWQADSAIVSVGKYRNFYVAASRQALVLLSESGEILEQQDISTGLPNHIQALGIDSDRLWLKTDLGQYQADEDLIEWQALQTLKPVDWIAAPTLSDKQYQQVANLARSAHLTWERVLLDLHSGRFFGKAGQLFMDLVALSLIFVCCTGFLIWYKQKAPKHPK